MSKLEGNVRKILFSNKNNGYTVGLIKVRKCDEELNDFLNKSITFTGIFDSINTEVTYGFEGTLIEHPRYGIQFNVSNSYFVEPTDEEGIILYLSSGLFKGIGYKLAERIVNKFGSKTISVIKENYASLLFVPGITEKKAKEMNASFAIINVCDEAMSIFTLTGLDKKLDISAK